ncbi:MAG: c-type cytochrome [Gammaproteobacteria bacterium]|nr:MAG: c-type cytochrome [Gammaproteobacteria bacterium]
MKKMIGTLVFAALSATAGQAVAAGDIDEGKTKAMACAACHGAAGISSNEAWPNLAGQKAGYLVKQLKAFRDGTRNDPVMSSMSKTLSDPDIDDLAAYYSSL